MLRPIYTEGFGLRLPLTPMMDANTFYIEIYRKTQTHLLGVDGPLGVHFWNSGSLEIGKVALASEL